MVDVHRHNWSAYIDFEGKLTEQLGFDVAGRVEDYSDFGTEFPVSWKRAAGLSHEPDWCGIYGFTADGLQNSIVHENAFGCDASK